MIANNAASLHENSIFKPGDNCWRAETATHAAILVDCANYYRDLHEALTKARHSIFITGWDIDSRIELLRDGKTKRDKTPRTLYALLTKKARENPDLKIYLNRWNYVFFMASIREPMAMWKWRTSLLPNIYYCHDNVLPVGACHHQKIVVVDDEVAFCGGMDVAIGRWDMRSHKPDNRKRLDPGGIHAPHKNHAYSPYHDIQTVVSGPAARALAEIVRVRWKLAAGFDAVPMRPAHGNNLPHCWPDSDPPDFVNIPVAIARTLPAHADEKGTYEIEQIYLDQIATAENFIYIENQYLTRTSIAEALNRQMMRKPNLRVLILSSYDPQGYMERTVMWAGRVKFKQLLEQNGMKDHVCLAYPTSLTKGKKDNVRIHSKIMAVDDKFLHIGSSNINNRSMLMDTECDLVYQGYDQKSCRKIADVRNDLIREHTGYEANDIETLVNTHALPSSFLKTLPHSTQHIVAIDDSIFFDKEPADVAVSMADPETAIIPDLPSPVPARGNPGYSLKRKTLTALFLALSALAIFAAWKGGFLANYISQDRMIETFESIRNAPGSIPAAIGIYVLCVMLFMPITLLTGAMAIVFNYTDALLISMSGAMISATLGFAIGHGLGPKVLRPFTGATMEKIKAVARNSHVPGLTFLRLLPIAPFSVVNIVLGLLQVPVIPYIAASFLGLVPGKLVTIFMAQSIGDLWTHPDLLTLSYAAGAILCWLGIVWCSHLAYRRWHLKNKAKV